MLQRGLNEQRLVLSEGRRELIKIDLDQILSGVWKSRNPESRTGAGNGTRTGTATATATGT